MEPYVARVVASQPVDWTLSDPRVTLVARPIAADLETYPAKLVGYSQRQRRYPIQLASTSLADRSETATALCAQNLLHACVPSQLQPSALCNLSVRDARGMLPARWSQLLPFPFRPTAPCSVSVSGVRGTPPARLSRQPLRTSSCAAAAAAQPHDGVALLIAVVSAALEPRELAASPFPSAPASLRIQAVPVDPETQLALASLLLPRDPSSPEGSAGALVAASIASADQVLDETFPTPARIVADALAVALAFSSFLPGLDALGVADVVSQDRLGQSVLAALLADQPAAPPLAGDSLVSLPADDDCAIVDFAAPVALHPACTYPGVDDVGAVLAAKTALGESVFPAVPPCHVGGRTGP